MQIIAHRGASVLAPENTLAAMQAAINSGAKAIEFDIHSHGDEFLVIHDRWLDHTTNGKGLLQAHSLEEIKQLDAGNGEVVPTLWQLLTLVNGQCALNIELKYVTHLPPLLNQLDLACEKLNFSADQFLISSFNHHLLKQLKALAPELKLGALTASRPTDECAFAEELDAYAVKLKIDTVCPELVNDAHQRGLKCYVYTVNQPDDWQWLDQMGVDGIFCDVPEIAVGSFPQSAVRPVWE
ncbi:glycerophosphodiester phosphodiesterase [Photobacterium sagamiensis]|uniref:glycerophosphodiester phosphodiesterase n=1 Tax=Photobacterium sagamiensis TaxID=2910241 RepID=UPI003D0D1CC4